ncbi:MAG TPA: hypothetical protein VI485_27990 [Vicinamibacterales bacterium]|nr:hypothetical protein [Vicinamibacterales bacterium]
MSRIALRNVASVYLGMVITLVVLALDFSGSVDIPWLLALIVSTLPLSGASMLGAWALIHGAGLEVFAVFFVGCGVFDVWATSRILRALSERRAQRAA